jgi:hypothetical protein
MYTEKSSFGDGGRKLSDLTSAMKTVYDPMMMFFTLHLPNLSKASLKSLKREKVNNGNYFHVS